MGERNLTGRVLKLRYGLTTCVSERGPGAVYLGWDEDDEEEVVVRIPHPDLLDDDEFVARFLAAEDSTSEVPGLVPVLSVGQDKDLPYAIVASVAGETMEQRMEAAGGKLAAEDILPWVRTVGRALSGLHALGMAHRSVSPRSVLVSEDGTVHLTDVAVARVLDEAPTMPEALNPGAFTAPEASSTAIGPAADQYSLAATIATAVMGDGFLTRQARKGMDRALVSRIPVGSVAALMKALDPDPEARHKSVEAFVQMFADALEELPSEPPMGEGTSTMLLTDVKDQVAAILEEAAALEEDDEEDVPLAEPILVAEPVSDDEPVDAVAEPILLEEVADPRPEPSNFRKKYAIVFAGIFAVLLVVGGWYFLRPKDEPVGPNVPGNNSTGPEVPPATIPDPPPDDTPPPDVPPPPVIPPEKFSARLELEGDAVPAMTAAKKLELSGRLVDGKGGWVEVAGQRYDPDDAGRFRASVTLSEGNNEIEIRFFDGKGRPGDPMEVEIERDSEAPSVTVTGPGPGTVFLEPVIVVTGRVMDAHPKEVRIGDQVFPVGKDRKFRAEVRLATEGENRLEIRGVDELGNESRPLPLKVELDTEGPKISIAGPAEGELTRNGIVKLTGTVSDPHLEGVTVNGRSIDVGERGEFAAEVEVAEGETEIRIVARDSVGHESTAVRHVTRDATSPSMTVSEPGTGITVGQAKITVRGRAQDPHPGPVTVNGKTVELDESGWFETEVELVPGENRIRIVGRDSVGNETAPVELLVTRDAQAADVTVTNSPEGEFEGETFTLRGEVSEDGCQVKVNGKDAVMTGRRFHVELPLTVGENPIKIQVTDRVGNVSPPKVQIIRRRPEGPPPNVPHLAEAGAGATVNGAPPARVPLGIAPGDRIAGPATIVTPAKDILRIPAGSVVQARKPDRGVLVFFVSKGSISGKITRATSVGVALGWLVIPPNSHAEFTAATVSASEARVRVADGSGVVMSGDYSVILGDAQSVKLFSTKAGDLRFQVPPRNTRGVSIQNRVSTRLTILTVVPPGYNGTIEQRGEGKRTRIMFETKMMAGSTPIIRTMVDGKQHDQARPLPNQFVVVDRSEDLGDISVKSK